MGKSRFNTSSLNFNLREPNKNRCTNIYAVIKIDNKQIKIATGLKINSWQWDKNKQIPIIDNKTNNEDRENLINIFNILYDFRFTFINYFMYVCINNVKPTGEDIREFINFNNNLIFYSGMNIENLRKGEGRKPKASNLVKNAFKIYYEEMHITIKESSIKANKSRLEAFLNYCKETGKDALSMLTQKGINDYQDYLLKKSKKEKEKGNKRYDSNKSINEKCELIERLINKVMVGHRSFTRYHIIPIKYNQLEEVNQKGQDKKRRPLKEEEVNKLINYQNLSEEEKEYRDLFILECNASYRVSDTAKLFDESKQEIIKKEDGYEYMVINTQKENILSVIWINDVIKEILNRYKDGFQYANPLSKVFVTKYNKIIKNVAKKAGLDTIETYINSHNEKEEKPLHEVIGSHFARYTFIYNGLNVMGFTPDELKDFTGHRDDRMIIECYNSETSTDKVNRVHKAMKRVEGEKSKINMKIAQENVDRLDDLSRKIIDALPKKSKITRNNINEQDDLLEEAREALYCLGADYNELKNINDYHTLNKMLYYDYYNLYMDMGCNMDYLKELYLNEDITTLKEKRELILKVIDEVGRKK